MSDNTHGQQRHSLTEGNERRLSYIGYMFFKKSRPLASAYGPQRSFKAKKNKINRWIDDTKIRSKTIRVD